MEDKCPQELGRFQESDIDFDWDAPTGDETNSERYPGQAPKAVRRGSCSRVRRAFWKARNLVVAYKKVALWREDDLTDAVESSRTIQRIQAKRCENGEPDTCPYLLRYYALRVIDTHHYQWLMEWVDYSLLDLIENEVFKKEAVCGGVARQLVEALRFLHVEVGLVHGDVSLANVLVVPNAVTLTDRKGEMGLFSTRLGDLEGCFPVGVSPGCFHGTYLFAAPEILAHRVEVVDFSVDVWSLGIAICMLLSGGNHPFIARAEPTFWDILDSLNNAKALNLQTHLKALLPGVSEEGIEFLCGCLSWEPSERLSTTQLTQLPWFSRYFG